MFYLKLSNKLPTEKNYIMIRGITRFKCNECSKKFWGLAFEWRATTLTTPLQCPQCKSLHTYPIGILGLGTGKAKLYKGIWEIYDNLPNK